ncbi:hypothetical protein BS78_10G021300 [Paspalum vaginatum]|nr:hypothetical protein BS78_10G021300 [Paspalum vaginatum]
MATTPAAAPPQQASRAATWAMAVLFQVAIIGYFAGVAYAYKRSIIPSFFTSNVVSVPPPRPLRLWASFGVYMSLAFLIKSYVDLFLPRTPAAVQRRFTRIGICAVCVGALNATVRVVLLVGVKSSRVLLGCTCGVAASIVGLLVFWGCLGAKYGGADPPIYYV